MRHSWSRLHDRCRLLEEGSREAAPARAATGQYEHANHVQIAPGRRASATASASVIILVHIASGMPDQATMNHIQRW